jgi:hypothetical protein
MIMKKLIVTVFLFFAVALSIAQTAGRENGRKVDFDTIKSSFNKDISKTQATAHNPYVPSVTLELSKDFDLSGSVKIQPPKSRGFFVSPNFDLGSTNKYTPLFDKGEWAINTSLGITFGGHIYSKRWFFGDDLDSAAKKRYIKDADLLNEIPDSIKQKICGYIKSDNCTETFLDKIPKNTVEKYRDIIWDRKPPNEQDRLTDSVRDFYIDEELKSQYTTLWISGDVKYNYKKYLLLKDSLYSSMSDAFDKIRKSDVFLTLQFNGLRAFSVRKGIQLQGSLAYSLSINSNNYEDLTEVKVSKDILIVDSTNKGINVSSKETSGRKGQLGFSTGHTLTGDIHFTVNPKNASLGIDLFARPVYTFNKDSKILNLKTGLNFAINNQADPKKSKTYINVGIAVDFKNLTKGVVGNTTLAQRIIPSLMLGIPLPTIAPE